VERVDNAPDRSSGCAAARSRCRHPLGDRLVLRLGRVRRARRSPASTATRGRSRSRPRSSTRRTRRARTSAAVAWHDEVYQFRDLRPDARVLLRVPDDQLDLDAPGARVRPFGYPLAWCFEEGAGACSRPASATSPPRGRARVPATPPGRTGAGRSRHLTRTTLRGERATLPPWNPW
jgi:hypothetical protein